MNRLLPFLFVGAALLAWEAAARSGLWSPLLFPSLEKISEQTGLRVKTQVLRRRVAQALTVPGVEREVEAAVVTTKPKVTTAELTGWRIAWSDTVDGLPVEPPVTQVLATAREAAVSLGAVVEAVEPDLAGADEATGTRSRKAA